MISDVDGMKPGLDYCTVTSSINAPNRVAARALVGQAAEELAETIWPNGIRRNLKKPGFSRYWVMENELTYKSAEHGNQLSVSGGRVAECWGVLATLVNNTNFTRLDLCLDAMLRKPDRDILKRYYERDSSDTESAGRRHNLKLVSSATGDTLYIGSRQSPLFCRIYDKSLDYNFSELGKMYRFETENKQGRGNQIAQMLVKNAADMPKYIHTQVVRDFGSRGVIIPSRFKLVEKLPKIEARVTTTELTLDWFQRQVAPSVGRLLDNNVSRETIQRALGIVSRETNSRNGLECIDKQSQRGDNE